MFLYQPNQSRRKSIKRRYLWGYIKDEIDFSSTGTYDWRYQLRILKIEMKFLFTMNRVNYETCLVNPLKSIHQEAGRRQILWRKQFSECSLTDMTIFSLNDPIHKSFYSLCSWSIFDSVASLDLGYENKLEFTEGSIKSQQF